MIRRFNFYDVYGYFLPGFALLVLVGMPFVIWGIPLPPIGATWAAVGVVIAYVIGHALQNITLGALPSKVKVGGAGGPWRHPSDYILDHGDATFDEEFKGRLGELVQREFGLDLAAGTRQREQAFFMARAALITRDVAGYAEQFEGMYSLTRGLAGACLLGGAYTAGWVLSAVGFACARTVGFALLALGLLIATYLSVTTSPSRGSGDGPALASRAALAAVAFSILAAGYSFGLHFEWTLTRSMEFAALFLFLCFLSSRFYLGYHFFALQFAKTVWRDFCGLRLPSDPRRAGLGT